MTIGGLVEKVAVVTGGASGIGAACVRLLETSGATAIVVDIEGGAPTDVTDRSALDAVAGSVESEHGGLDVLVNAAGILTQNLPVDQLPADDFRRAYEVNVIGTLNACQAFGPLLRIRRGAVVNVASQAALVSLPQQAAYTAAKGAVAALTRSLAIDWAEHGVRANAVAPGFTMTPMTEAFFESETFTEAATQRIPLGRILVGGRDRVRDRVPGQPTRECDHRCRAAGRRRLDRRGARAALVVRRARASRASSPMLRTRRPGERGPRAAGAGLSRARRRAGAGGTRRAISARRGRPRTASCRVTRRPAGLVSRGRGLPRSRTRSTPHECRRRRCARRPLS